MILGALAGDTIGSVYEFHNIKSAEFPLFSDGSRLTDDSMMTLAVAAALLEARDGEPVSFALVEMMRTIGRAHPDAGYGGRFMRWLMAPNDYPQPYNSWGNGSAMRVSPVAWAFDTIEAVELMAAETAKVTHNHPEGIRGAQAAAGCAFLTRAGATKEQVRSYAQERFGYALDFMLDDIRDEYTFDVSCQGSVPQAIEAFLEANSFEETIRLAVSIGGDSDTIAAIAAGIAQGMYGVPAELAEEVRKRIPADVLPINDLFCETFMAGADKR